MLKQRLVILLLAALQKFAENLMHLMLFPRPLSSVQRASKAISRTGNRIYRKTKTWRKRSANFNAVQKSFEMASKVHSSSFIIDRVV